MLFVFHSVLIYYTVGHRVRFASSGRCVRSLVPFQTLLSVLFVVLLSNFLYCY